jgi:hypothetical protein
VPPSDDTTPTGADPPRAPAYRLPGADFVITAVGWVIVLTGAFCAAYAMAGSLNRAGFVDVDPEAFFETLLASLVPAGIGMGVVRLLLPARVMDWLLLLPILLFVGVVLVSLVPLAIVTTVMLGLQALGADISRTWPPLVALCHVIGLYWAVAVWIKYRSMAEKPKADESADPAAAAPAEP